MAESTCYRLALNDKKSYPDIITQENNGDVYYTNSCHLPVKEINKYAFSEQPFIEKIIYQNIDNIISIGNEAFKDTNIRILNIGKNVSNIGYGICTNCKNLHAT